MAERCGSHQKGTPLSDLQHGCKGSLQVHLSLVPERIVHRRHNPPQGLPIELAVLGVGGAILVEGVDQEVPLLTVEQLVERHACQGAIGA